MSIQHLNLAFSVPITGAKKSVLISLADRADKAGYCHPGLDDIALRSGCTKRTVINSIVELEKLGFLIAIREQGRCNKYLLMTEKLYTTSETTSPVELSTAGEAVTTTSETVTETSETISPKPLEPPRTKEKDYFKNKNQKIKNQINPVAYKFFKPEPQKPKAKKSVVNENLKHIHNLIGGCHG